MSKEDIKRFNKMNEKEALKLMKDINMKFIVDEEFKEQEFLTILKNYVDIDDINENWIRLKDLESLNVIINDFKCNCNDLGICAECAFKELWEKLTGFNNE